MKRALVLAAVSATSLLGLVPVAQAELRVSKNYRLNSDQATFRGKDAVALAVNPRNAQHIVEVNANLLSEECESTVSFDGGSSWSAALPFTTPAPGPGQQPFVRTCRASNHLADYQFQTVEFGSGDNVYATTTTPRQAAGGGESGASVLLFKSTDGGRTFGTGVIAMAGGASGDTETGGPYYELPSLTVDPGAGPGGADRVIVAAIEVTNFGDTGCVPVLPRGEPGTPERVASDAERARCAIGRGDAMVAVSNDGGASFSGPVQAEPRGENVAGPDTTSNPVVLPDHSIAVAWRTAGQTGQIRVGRSTNAGQSFTVTTAATVTNRAANTADPPGPAPSTGSSFPRLAVGGGNLYLVYNQGGDPPGPPPGGFEAADHFIPPDSDVYFQRSSNNGATWSTPQVINDPTPRPGHESPANPRPFGVVTQTRHPYIDVAPNGRVDIVWQDRRHWYRGCIHTHVRCEEARLGDTYYSFSNDAGSTFSANKRISDRSHNNDVGYDYRFGTGWTFGPALTHIGDSQLLVGWMDAREGSFDNDNQDIYLAKVDHNAPSTVPQESLTRTDPVNTSVRLSRHAYPGGGEGLLASTFATRNGTRAVIVNENDYPAILAAGVLARANLSQVLLSPPGGLPESVRADVARMKPAGVFLVGDTGSLSSQIVEDLEHAGIPNDQVVRLGGGGAAGTAAAIARNLDRRNAVERAANAPAFNAVMIANPESPDAAAAAGLAAARRLPFLFVSNNSVPADTASALTALQIDKALVVGGPQWVSDAVMGQLPNAERLGGANQYATSRAVVAESLTRGLPPNIGYVADGARPIDGALLGSVVGRVTGLLLLSPAPLSSTARDTAAANGLSALMDRLILLEPAAGGGGGPTPRPTPAFGDCPPRTANVITGNAASNSLVGTPQGDRIFAGAGNDTVDALAGDDCVDLGPGTDRGQGGAGADLIVGGLGRDRMAGSAGNDRLRGGSSADRLIGGFGNDRLSGQSGADRINGERGRDRINGGSSGDVISAGSSGDRVTGAQGNDRINGNSGNDSLSGNSGKDRIKGSTGRDRISGGSASDRIDARDGQRDRVNCGTGRDRVIADRVDRIARNCERVSRRATGRSSGLKSSALGGIAGLLGGAFAGLLGWRRRP